MTEYICSECGKPCDVEEKLVRESSEHFGFKKVHENYYNVSVCCQAEAYIKEESDE